MNSSQDLGGKVAAITGASSGIGEATALALAGAGAAVALAARRSDRIEELASRIEKDGGRAIAVPTDITKETEARAFVEQANEQLGRVDVLVNNAGLMLLGPVYGADVEEWRRMVEVNMLGLLYCTHAALPIMGGQGGGHIVNVSSVAGRNATFGSAVYNLTKFGVNGFSEALRQELQGHNTHPMVVDALQKAHDEIGEPLAAGDIADAILYAVSRPAHVSVNEALIRPTGQRR
jgi:clavulanate-9-aldehyde reductase